MVRRRCIEAVLALALSVAVVPAMAQQAASANTENSRKVAVEKTAENKTAQPQFIQGLEIPASNTKTVKHSSEQVSSVLDKLNSLKDVTTPLYTAFDLPNMMIDKFAASMGVDTKSVNNFSLYGFINDWLGVRYRMGGTSKKGVDCSAFVQKLYSQVFGVDLVRTSREQFFSCRYVKNVDELKEGDLVFFKTSGKGLVTHVGVYLQNNRFVHASSSSGVMISSLLDNYWVKRYVGGGKIQP